MFDSTQRWEWSASCGAASCSTPSTSDATRKARSRQDSISVKAGRIPRLPGILQMRPWCEELRTWGVTEQEDGAELPP